MPFAVAGARDDHRFAGPVDLVIETKEQWRAHRQAALRTPALFEGMSIGVDVPSDSAVSKGGPEAEAADAALDKLTARPDRHLRVASESIWHVRERRPRRTSFRATRPRASM
jgi:hypothetical protein